MIMSMPMSRESEIILHHCLTDENLLKQYYKEFKSDYFDGDQTIAKVIWDALVEYYGSHEALPSEKEMVSQVDMLVQNPLNKYPESEISTIQQNVKQLYASDTGLSYAQAQLKIHELMCAGASCDALVKYQEYRDRNNVNPESCSKAAAYLREAADILERPLKPRENTNIYSDPDALLRMAQEATVRTDIPIEALQKLSNGVADKTLTVIQANLNTGKSMALLNLAVGWSKANLDVLFLTAESDKKDVARRLVAHVLQEPIDELGNVKNTKKLAEVIASRNALYVEDIEGSISTDEIETMLRTTYKGVDIVIIDYLDYVTPPKAFIKADGYEKLRAICRTLRALAKKYDCIIWTAAQNNREGMKESSTDTKYIAGSIGIAYVADNIFSLEVKNEYVRWKMLRSRQSQLDNEPIYGKRDTSKMMFMNLALGEEKRAQEAFDVSPLIEDSKERTIKRFGKKDQKRKVFDDASLKDFTV